MRTTVAIRSAWLRSAALLTLAALAVFAPTSAQAGCKSHRAAPTSYAGLARLSGLWDPGASSDPTTPVPAKAPTPCSGALCSGLPAAPVGPVFAPIVVSSQWALPAARPDNFKLDSDLLPSDESDSLPSFRGLS